MDAEDVKSEASTKKAARENTETQQPRTSPPNALPGADETRSAPHHSWRPSTQHPQPQGPGSIPAALAPFHPPPPPPVNATFLPHDDASASKAKPGRGTCNVPIPQGIVGPGERGGARMPLPRPNGSPEELPQRLP